MEELVRSSANNSWLEGRKVRNDISAKLTPYLGAEVEVRVSETPVLKPPPQASRDPS
jgi:hypothetical protein